MADTTTWLVYIMPGGAGRAGSGGGNECGGPGGAVVVHSMLVTAMTVESVMYTAAYTKPATMRDGVLPHACPTQYTNTKLASVIHVMCTKLLA